MTPILPKNPILRERDQIVINNYIKTQKLKCPTRQPNQHDETRIVPLHVALCIAEDWYEQICQEVFSDRYREHQRHQKRRERSCSLHTKYSGKIGGY